MKRILYIETGTEGHHIEYLKGLINIKSFEVYVYTPEIICNINAKQEVHYINFKQKNYSDYRRWISHAATYAKMNNIDIIHFVDGDTIMRYMGSLFSKFGNRPIVITYHHYFEGYLRLLSYKNMLKGHRQAVVHTDLIKENFLRNRITNVTHIEYPVFSYNQIKQQDVIECKKYFNLPTDRPILGCIGATDSYKGTRVFLNALEKINMDLCVFFAGKESDITSQEIDSYNFSEKIRIEKRFGWLSDQEYIKAICASDYLILPYTDKFNGASGLLADGTVAGKCIIGSDYASLGRNIQENNLGYTFKVNNSDDLANVIRNIVGKQKKYDYENLNRQEYCNTLMPDRFLASYRSLYTCLSES